MPTHSQTIESKSAAIKTDSPLQAELVAQAVVVEDEYGDPVIQGAYPGRDQLNLEALLPGRKEAEDDSLPAEDADAAAAAAAKLAQKKTLGRIFIGIMLGAPILAWLIFYSTANSQLIERNARTAREAALSSTAKIATDTVKRAGTFDDLLIGAVELSNRGDRAGAEILFDRCATLAGTRDQAMQLIVFADAFVAKKQPRLAELFYRRALQVLGLSVGTTSWEYMQSLTRLSLFCRSMQRLKEAEDIDSYIVRLTVPSSEKTVPSPELTVPSPN